MLLALLAVGIVAPVGPVAAQVAPPDRPVTFNKDVAPILQKSCQQCHRPESIAPMSLLTYEQTRPFARAIKQRTQLAYVTGMRGVMPPWLLERNIGIQSIKEDFRLSDESIAILAKWADTGAVEGNPADLPPALSFADNSRWFLGKPDLIAVSPPLAVKGVGPDWWGDVGDASPLPLTEDRYAASAEYKETSDITKSAGALKSTTTADTYPGQGKTSIFVFHHASSSVRRPAEVREEVFDNEIPTGGAFPNHEVGHNGHAFADGAGRLVPAKGIWSFTGAHVHSPGVPGADRNVVLTIGVRLHPKGYKPTFKEANVGLSSSELDVSPESANQRYDAYYVVKQPMELTNFEPHMHAAGMRMCIEAIYEQSVETLDCAGYDHNWVREYSYEENYAPLLPPGTILHSISWFDGSARNGNLIDSRNTTVWGRRSVENMLGTNNRAFFLTEEEYQSELAKRREFLTRTDSWGTLIGCPDCYQVPAKRGDLKPSSRPPAPAATAAKPTAPARSGPAAEATKQ
jgi:hypothetical protein